MLLALLKIQRIQLEKTCIIVGIVTGPFLKEEYPDLLNDLGKPIFYSSLWFVFYFRHRELSDLYVKLYN